MLPPIAMLPTLTRILLRREAEAWLLTIHPFSSALTVSAVRQLFNNSDQNRNYPGYHVSCKITICHAKLPGSALQMRDFCEALGPLGEVASTWPGFIWTHDNDETIRIAENLYDTDVAANLSVWRDVESLYGFMECPHHAAVMKRRSVWLVAMPEATFVMW